MAEKNALNIPLPPCTQTPELKREYLDMIPEFHGEPAILPRFLEVCERVVTRFYDVNDPNNFQNEYLMYSLLAKIKGSAAEVVHNSKITNWLELKSTLINGYSDRRDCYTLTLEMGELWQGINESPFDFFYRIQKLLNLLIAYYKNHITDDQADILIVFSRKLALRVLLRGLRDPIGSQMRTKNPTDLDTALNMLTNDFQIKSKSEPSKSFLPKNNNPQNYPKQKRFFNKENSDPFRNGNNVYQRKDPQNHSDPNNRYPSNPHNVSNYSNSQFCKETPMSISTYNTRPNYKPSNKPPNRPQNGQSYNIETSISGQTPFENNSEQTQNFVDNNPDHFLVEGASDNLN